jgi:lysophospholipase L1-like esterase
VIRHQPDWLSVKIGINDVHRFLRQTEGSLDAKNFASVYERILERVRKETKAKLVLVEPFYISTDKAPDSFRRVVLEQLPSFQKAVHALAKKHRAPLVRLHTMFQEQLKHHPPDRFCPEPVHPNPSGHLLMAHEWLKAVGW